MSEWTQWLKRHPQRVMGFVQVTLSQIAMWDFLPVKVVAAMNGVVGLLQVWSAFFFSRKEQAVVAKEPE